VVLAKDFGVEFGFISISAWSRDGFLGGPTQWFLSRFGGNSFVGRHYAPIHCELIISSLNTSPSHQAALALTLCYSLKFWRFPLTLKRTQLIILSACSMLDGAQ